MKGERVIWQGLSMIGHLGLLMLIPLLLCIWGGNALDRYFQIEPICTCVGALVGMAAAFRNLYVWSRRQIADNAKSERIQRALREEGKAEQDVDREE